MSSLFGFVKDIGRRVFNKDEDAAEKIKEHIEANNPGVKDLEVTFDNGIVGLQGECVSGEAHQKVVLMAGNCAGVTDVYASNLSYPKPAPAEQGGAEMVEPEAGGAAEVPDVEFYVIQPGDTLSKLAKQHYGDAMQYPKIFEANREVIEDPDKIFVGQKIRIPKA
ncbi:MAG: peptidoglycan-binding protein LysM [Gammaproteobacteria bacterium]|nr:peptidoglycan-binding protein LysM [Gammaproteobacteria bacterium]